MQTLWLVSVPFTVNEITNGSTQKHQNNWRLQCLLIMYNHGSITVGSFLFDDADQFKSFANRTVRIWPFWTLKMPHFKYIVILKEWKKHKSIWWKIDWLDSYPCLCCSLAPISRYRTPPLWKLDCLIPSVPRLPTEITPSLGVSRAWDFTTHLP